MKKLQDMTFDELHALKLETENKRNDAESSMASWYNEDLNAIDEAMDKLR